MSLLIFPNFNLYSSPLLLLSLQGIFFGFLLFFRYLKNKRTSDLLLSFIVFITCYHRTAYTIGFMDWYDTFPTTKINYYLVEMSLVLAPLIYFYVKSITSSNFKLTKKDSWHFAPWIAYFLIKAFILIFDSSSPNFDSVQNGPLVVNFEWKYLEPIIGVVSIMQMLFYLVLTFQIYTIYRKRIQDFFSNTYTIELNWLRNFLYVYTLLYLFNSIQMIINELVFDLSWTQEWWYHFFSAIAIIYVSVKGYFTPSTKLSDLGFEYNNFRFEKMQPSPAQKPSTKKQMSPVIQEKKKMVEVFTTENKPYLDPDINLITFAKQLNMSREELSEVINIGFNLKFNDFVNQYRINAVKQMFYDGKHKQLSLIGIATECGFNSKATFNRVFKKITNNSPTEFLNQL